MTMRRAAGAAWLTASFAALGGCAGNAPPPSTARSEVAPGAAEPWRVVATAADRARLRGWRRAWTDALAQSPDATRGAAGDVLLRPDAGLDQPQIPPGDYRCRTIKIGRGNATRSPGPGYVAYPYFTCRVARSGEGLRLSKRDGSQRPIGRLFAGASTRMVFLGTMQLGPESATIDYGRDPDRDMAGFVERIGPARWRLVLPYPRWESTLDVLELVPKT